MRFLADESCDFAVVVGLRAAGHDITAQVEQSPGMSDDEVIDIACSQQRILLTEDKDFGQLVFAAAKQAAGVVLIRYPTGSRADLVPALSTLLATRGSGLYGHFTVVEPGRVRITPLP